jgi:hypothetical protein
MHTGHPRLGDRWVIQLGVKTGANHVFLNCREPIEPSLVRWALRGRDIRPFRGERRATIIWTHDRAGRVYPSLPPLASEYFDRHLAILRARIDYRGGPPWALFRTRPATAPHRVVWSDLARALTALALSDPGAGECIPLNSCYVIALDSNLEAACLAAWLNCTWVRAAARLSAAPASGGFFRFNARIVGALPFPQAAAEDAVLPQLAAAAARGTVAQEDLDARCAELLGLSINARRALGKAADIPPGC